MYEREAIVGSAISLLGCSIERGDDRYATVDVMAVTGEKTDDWLLIGIWDDACGRGADAGDEN